MHRPHQSGISLLLAFLIPLVSLGSTTGWGQQAETTSSIAVFPTTRVTGFFQSDAAWFHQNQANTVAVGDIQDGADFRRARLAAVGDVADNVSYMVEFDFGFPGRPSFMDVWLEIQDLPLLQNVKVG